MSKKIDCFRSFPHSNSERENAGRFESDLKEMAEEGIASDSMPKLRGGKHRTPDSYDDVMRHDMTKPWETKRKGTRHRNRESIRTKPVEEEEDEELNL